MKQVILVNNNDEPIGYADKLEAHQKGLLHRAFSVMLYRSRLDHEIEVLLQKRAKEKYHSIELWSNTCCSHPISNETVQEAANRRLMEELGLSNLSLQEIGVFHYHVSLDTGLIENEIDHVLIGNYQNETIRLNTSEVSEVRWISLSKLKNELQKNPELYTPWLPNVVDMLDHFFV